MGTPSVPTEQVVDMSPFKMLVMTIGTLPTAFTESMTYYEALAYFVKYLEETVIPAINQNAEAVTELQSLFIQLKDYVDNYFDNLDVQEEINNKLDEMAEDGTLAEIVTAYLNAKSILAYNTVQEMSEATNIIDGSFLATYGKDTFNDGKGEFYKARQIRNTDVVDGVNIIALADEDLVAELIRNGRFEALEADVDNLETNKTNLDELNQKRLQGNFNTYGCFEKATFGSMMVNRENERPEVLGIRNSSDLSAYTNRDCTAFYAGANPSDPILSYDENDTVYTSTTVSCPSLTTEQVEMLTNTDLTDTIIDTYNLNNGGPISRYASLLDSFDPTNKTFTIKDGWYGVPGDGTTTYTPTNGLGIYIGLCTKVWGGNIVAYLPSNNRCSSGTGLEVELVNNKPHAQDCCILDLLGDRGEDSTLYDIPYGLKIRGTSTTRTIGNGMLFQNINQALIRAKGFTGNDKYILWMQDSSNNTTYYLMADGTTSTPRLRQNLISSASQNPDSTRGYKAYAISGYGGAYLNFHRPTDGGRIYIIQNTMNTALNLQYVGGDNVTRQMTIPAQTTKMVIADGNSWKFIS